MYMRACYWSYTTRHDIWGDEIITLNQLITLHICESSITLEVIFMDMHGSDGVMTK